MILGLLHTLLVLPQVLFHTAAADDDGWSMKVPLEVRAIEGYPVVLPCSFSHPHHKHHTSMLVRWKMGHGPGAAVLFQCASLNVSLQCRAEPHQDQRYRLEGNPHEHDLSLRINSAALQDSGHYYCQVALPGHPRDSYENKKGIHLRVEAAPQILELSVEGSEASGYRAVCRAQGSPIPDIQWSRANEPLEGTAVVQPGQESSGRHRGTSLLQDIVPGLQYTCTVSNALGKDQATLYLLHPSPPQHSSGHPGVFLLLSVSLGIKAVLFLGWGVWLVWGRGLSWVSCPVTDRPFPPPTQ